MTRYYGTTRSHEWEMQRDEAETVACEECDQPVGETCLSLADGQELGRLPAHARRIRAADQRKVTYCLKTAKEG